MPGLGPVSGLGLTTHCLPLPPKAFEPENLNPKLKQIMDAYKVESSLLRMLLRQLPTPGQGGGYLNRCGTYKTVKARFWPWRSGYSPQNLSSVPSLLGNFPSRGGGAVTLIDEHQPPLTRVDRLFSS